MPLVSKTFADIITFTRASTANYFNSAGVLTNAAINEPRLDYNPATLAAQGLLIEEQRTNSILNNTMVGAVAGTPGTLPTNWSIGNATGLTTAVVSTGTEDGISYIDIRFSGVTSTTAMWVLYNALSTAAVQNQTWTGSSYCRLVGGSLTNILTTRNILVAANSGNAILSAGSTDFSPTAQSLKTQRNSTTYTIPDVTAALVYQRLDFTFSIGAAIDITLRIGLPQLEQGAFATSVIPTSTVALTRAADVASVNTLSPWYNASEGTFYGEISVPQLGRAARIFVVDDGTTNNQIDTTLSEGNNFAIESVASGVYGGSSGTANTITANTIQKTAATYSTGLNETVCLNGGTAASANVTLPSVSLTTMRLGQQSNFAAILNGHLRRITYYPRRLSDAELQTLTT